MGKSAYFFLIIFLFCTTLFAQLDCKISSNSNIVVQPVVEQKSLTFKFFSVSKGSLIKELKINNLKASQVKSYLINDNANILCINTKSERWVYNVRTGFRITQMGIEDEIFFIEQSNYFLKQVGFYKDIYLLNSYDATPLDVNSIGSETCTL